MTASDARSRSATRLARASRASPAAAATCGADELALLLQLVLRTRGGRRPLIDAALGKLRELVVGRLLFVERLLQQLRGVGVPQGLCPGYQRPVCGHLVVLHALCGGDDTGIHRVIVEVLFEYRLSLFDDAGDAITVLAASLFIEAGKHLLQAGHLVTRLSE